MIFLARRYRIGHVLVSTLLIAATSVPGRKQASAQEQVYEIASLKARLEVLPDGSYRIREEITYDFQSGSFTFGVRDIPLANSEGVGPVDVRSPDVEVTGVEQRNEGGSRRVRWEFPSTTGVATFVIEYDVVRALREVGETNEIFWRVVGEGWDVPFRDVEAEVFIPPSIPVSRADLALDPAEISSIRNEGAVLVARFRPGSLPAGRAYQVRVSFPKVMEGRAIGLARPEAQATLVASLAFALFLILGVVVTYQRQGPRLPPRRQTHPGMTLPEAAVLLHRASPTWDRVFPATLFDLADRGVITLERVDEKNGIFTKQKVRLHRNQESDEALTSFEEALLAELETHDDLEDFARKGKGFRRETMEGVREHLVESGLLLDNRRKAGKVAVAAIAIGGLTLALFAVGAALGSPWLMAVVGPGLGAAIGAAIVASARYARSRKGSEQLAALKGYLEGVREELKQRMRVSPISGAECFFASLPWLTLDPKYVGTEGQKIKRMLKKETGELRALPWAVDRTKAYEKVAAKYSPAHAAFVPVLNVTGATSGAVAPTAGGGVGGAAGGGAAGGGGGGAG
jgi:hypothetical protein